MDPQRLAAVPLFATLSEDDLVELAGIAREVELAQGDRLTVEGEFGHCLYAIEAGTADVLANGLRISAVGPGDVVGEVAILASGRRTATIVATTHMRLISLFKRDIWALERKAPPVAERLRELVATHAEAVLRAAD